MINTKAVMQLFDIMMCLILIHILFVPKINAQWLDNAVRETVFHFEHNQNLVKLLVYDKWDSIICEGIFSTKIDSISPQTFNYKQQYYPVGEIIQYTHYGADMSYVSILFFDEYARLDSICRTYRRQKNKEELTQQTFYKKGLKDGLAIDYQDGKILYSHTYKENMLYGQFIIYYHTLENEYAPDDCIGCYSVGYYKNGKYDSTLITYTKEGKILEYWTYKNDTLHGLHYEMKVDSVLYEKLYYVNGTKEGSFIKPALFGGSTTGVYKNNGYDGLIITKEADGTLKQEIMYQNGLAHGIIRNYINGHLVEEGQHKEGKAEGEWKRYEYDEKGKKISSQIMNYKKGVRVK